MGGKLKVVFLGTSAFGLPALRAMREAGHEIPLVVTRPDRPRGRGRRTAPPHIKEAAVALGIPVVQPERVGEIAADLEALAPDALVVAAYGPYLPRSILSSPTIAAVNVHPSLLPRYRGAAPIPWAIIHGDRETGVSVLRVVREMDAGPILAARTVPIGEEETAGELERRLAGIGAELMVEVLSDLRGHLGRERPQDDSAVTLAPRLEKEDGRLTFDQTPEAFRDRVRGLQPRPGTYADLRREGERRRVRIHQVRVAAGAAGEPGTVIEVGGQGITVAVKGGSIVILRIQPEGGKGMAAADYIRGHPILAGDRFV